jgi:hypothetical protein
MDMNSAFDLEGKAQCPNAEVVYYLFHVVVNTGEKSLIGCARTKPIACAPTSLHDEW